MNEGDLLIPSFYMEANGKKITGIVLGMGEGKVRVFLNNGKDCWLDTKTVHDLFQIVDIRCMQEAI